VSATSYSVSSLSQVQDVTREFGGLYPLFFAQPAGLSAFDIELGLKKFTQEVRLASPNSARFEWLVGFFYTDEDATNRQLLTAQQFNGAPVPGADPLFRGSIPSTYKEYSGFGDATFHVTDRFDIGAGVRYSHNDQTFGQVESGSIFPSSNTVGSSSANTWTYSVDTSYHFTRDAMLYGRIASAFEPGGPNVNVPGVPPTFQPSTLVSYEAGLKSQFWDRRALLDVSVFDVELANIQVAGDASGFGFYANGGTARSRGVEANASLRVTDDLVLAATGAYDDAVLTANVPALGALKGDRLPNVPRWSGSLRANYSHPLTGDWKAEASAGVRYVGDEVSFPNHSFLSFRPPAYGLLDLSADVTDGRWKVAVFAKNVTDERAYTGYATLVSEVTGAPDQVLGSVLQPRTIGVSVDAAF
jgi:outer membrane receptor protein involved in Fe transport